MKIWDITGCGEERGYDAADEASLPARTKLTQDASQQDVPSFTGSFLRTY